MPEAIDDALEKVAEIAALRPAELRYSIRKLRAWRELAMNGLRIEPGGQAVINSLFPPIPKSSGWHCYRECLRSGQVGRVGKIDINPDTGTVTALFTPEPLWSVHDRGTETVRYPCENKSFYMAVKYLDPVVATEPELGDNTDA